jgi:hypothetical protein
MTIELTCRICGRCYTPTDDDIRRGPEVSHRCLDCRPAGGAGEKPVGVWQSNDELARKRP